MKTVTAIKKYAINILAAAAGIFVFSLSAAASELPAQSISAEYTLKNGFAYTVNAMEKDKPVLDEDGTLLSVEKEYSLVLPYAVKEQQVKIVFEDAQGFEIDGKEYISGEKYILEEGSFAVTCDGKEYSLNIFYTSDTPQIYLTLDESIEYINAEQGNISSGTVMITDGANTLYDGGLEYIKGRGNATWEKDKKPYNIKLESKVALFGMERSKKYSLLANYLDATAVRNKLAMDLADKVGIDFCSQSQFVEVYADNCYMGLYLLTERVEVAEGRVDIVDLDYINENANPKTDIASCPQQSNVSNDDYAEGGAYKWTDIPNDMAEDLGGGYLLEVEMAGRYYYEPSGFVSEIGETFVIKSPEYASQKQVEYIREYYQQYEDAVLSPTGYNSQGHHYSEYIDVESMARMYLLQEYVQNLDAGITSFYLYKDVNGKLTACSAWDFDYSLGNEYSSMGYNMANPENIWVAIGGMQHSWRKKCMFTALWQYADFRLEVIRQWHEIFVPQMEWFNDYSREMTESVKASAVLNNFLWKEYSTVKQAEEDYNNKTDAMFDFISKRASFLSGYLSEGRYNVLYYNNGGNGVVVDANLYAPGSTATVVEIGRVKNRTDKEKYLFSGWNTEPDGSGTGYMPGDVISIEDKDVSLYAQWDGISAQQTEQMQSEPKQGLLAKIISAISSLLAK